MLESCCDDKSLLLCSVGSSVADTDTDSVCGSCTCTCTCAGTCACADTIAAAGVGANAAAVVVVGTVGPRSGVCVGTTSEGSAEDLSK